MKKSYLLAILTLAAGPVVHPPVSNAAEKGTVCASEGVADAGFTLSIAADSKTAVLSEESFVGARKVADMDCEALPTKNFPDYLNNYLICRDARASSSGLVARLYSGGFAGIHYASVLSTTSMRGKGNEKEVQFGHLNCRQ
jgi:hypothetical protein